MCERTAFAVGYSNRTFLTIGHEAVAIVGIVVVQTAVGVDDMDIVGIPGVGGARPPMRRRQHENSYFPKGC